MERSFSYTLESLRYHQGQSYNELLFTTENLLLQTSRQLSSEQQDKLRLFTSTPQLTQAVWEDDSDTQYHHNALGITVFNDGLTIGVRTKDPTKPRYHIAIGMHYANLSEYKAVRPDIYEHPLDNEHLTLFSHHFETAIAQLGLASIIREGRSPKAA